MSDIHPVYYELFVCFVWLSNNCNAAMHQNMATSGFEAVVLDKYDE
jgi:hypothetical protein